MILNELLQPAKNTLCLVQSCLLKWKWVSRDVTSAAHRQADPAAWRWRLSKSIYTETHTRVSRLYAVFFKSCNALCMNSNAWQSTQGRPGKRCRRHQCHSMKSGVWQYREGLLRDPAIPGETPLYQAPASARVRSSGCRWPGLYLSLGKRVRTSKTTGAFCCVCFSEHSPGLILPGAVCLQPPASPLTTEILSPPQTWVNSQPMHWK